MMEDLLQQDINDEWCAHKIVGKELKNKIFFLYIGSLCQTASDA